MRNFASETTDIIFIIVRVCRLVQGSYGDAYRYLRRLKHVERAERLFQKMMLEDVVVLITFLLLRRHQEHRDDVMH